MDKNKQIRFWSKIDKTMKTEQLLTVVQSGNSIIDESLFHLGLQPVFENDVVKVEGWGVGYVCTQDFSVFIISLDLQTMKRVSYELLSENKLIILGNLHQNSDTYKLGSSVEPVNTSSIQHLL